MPQKTTTAQEAEQVTESVVRTSEERKTRVAEPEGEMYWPEVPAFCNVYPWVVQSTEGVFRSAGRLAVIQVTVPLNLDGDNASLQPHTGQSQK